MDPKPVQETTSTAQPETTLPIPEKPVVPPVETPQAQASPTPPMPPAEPKKGNPFGKMLIILLLLVLMGAVGGISYYMGIQQGRSQQLETIMKQTKENLAKLTPTKIPLSTPTPDPTASWSAYINTSLKYSLKYPPSFTPNEKQTQGETFFGKQIYVYTTKTDPLQCKGDCPLILNTSNTTINGAKGTYVEAKQGNVGGNIAGPILWYQFLQNGTYYIFIYQTQALGVAPDEQNIFAQMAQTFTLTQ